MFTLESNNIMFCWHYWCKLLTLTKKQARIYETVLLIYKQLKVKVFMLLWSANSPHKQRYDFIDTWERSDVWNTGIKEYLKLILCNLWSTCTVEFATHVIC